MTAGQNQLEERKKNRSRRNTDQSAPEPLLLPLFLTRPSSAARTGLWYVIPLRVVPLGDFRLLRLVEPSGVEIILCNHLYLRT